MCPPPPILDDRKWILIAFLAILDQYETLNCFHKMAAGGHFGWPKITFDRISRHFRSMVIVFIWFTKWLPAAILDDRKSLSIALFAISDQYATFFFTKWLQPVGCSQFGWPKITFDRISRHFRSIRNFFIYKMAASGHFGWPKITFDSISHHFRSIRNFDFFWFFFTKWLPATILDDRKSLWSHFSPF